MPVLLTDDFYERVLVDLDLAGYVITLVQRYEPTVIEGTTPGGKSFTYTVSQSGRTLRYVKRTINKAATADWWVPDVIRDDVKAAVAAAGG